MKKTLGWLAIGVAVGIVVALLMRPSTSGRSDTEGAATLTTTTAMAEGQEIARLTSRLADVESQLQELIEEQRVLRTEAASTEALASEFQRQANSPEAQATVASFREFLVSRELQGSGILVDRLVGGFPGSDNLAERLVAGGFTASRAEEIKRLSDELAMSAIEARYDAERGGADSAAVPVLIPGPNSMLRQELGDTEYEQYLLALGQDRPVNVMTVVGNSPAALAGLQVGDQIVSYGGARVFDFTEVTPLTAQGTPGEPVIVDILRDGQPMQIVVPRGPLGVRLAPAGLSFGIQ